MPSIRTALLLTAIAAPASAQTTVVTDMPVTAAIARAVVGDLGTVSSLLDGTTSAHSFSLRPSQARLLQDADLLAWVSEAQTPWLEESAENRTGPSLKLLEVAGTHVQEGGAHHHDHGEEGHGDDHGDHDDHGHDEEKHGDDHGHGDDGHDDHGHDEHGDKDHAHDDHGDDDHGHDDHGDEHGEDDHAHDADHKEEDHDHEGHDHGEHDDHGHDDHGHDDHGHDDRGHDDHAGHDHHDHDVDPHAWFDPENAVLWATALAVELAKIDPANAGAYITNAAAFGEEVDALEAELSARYEALPSKPFAYHDAFGYLRELGFEVANTLAASDAQAPGPATLRAVREEIAAQGSACLLSDPETPASMLESLASDTGVTIMQVHPAGLGEQTYVEFMTGFADTVEACTAG